MVIIATQSGSDRNKQQISASKHAGFAQLQAYIVCPHLMSPSTNNLFFQVPSDHKEGRIQFVHANLNPNNSPSPTHLSSQESGERGPSLIHTTSQGIVMLRALPPLFHGPATILFCFINLLLSRSTTNRMVQSVRLAGAAKHDTTSRRQYESTHNMLLAMQIEANGSLRYLYTLTCWSNCMTQPGYDLLRLIVHDDRTSAGKMSSLRTIANRKSTLAKQCHCRVPDFLLGESVQLDRQLIKLNLKKGCNSGTLSSLRLVFQLNKSGEEI